MSWFNIIKVEDIDFDNAIQAFGQYSAESKEPAEMIPKIMLWHMQGEKKNITYQDIMSEKIRINPKIINEYLTARLGIPPSDKQLIEYITRVIMHEATHAGMGEEQMVMTDNQAEYGAYTGQFPESPYLALKQWLLHPTTKINWLPPDMQEAMGMTARQLIPAVEKVRELITFTDGLTHGMAQNQATLDLSDKIVKLEMLARKGTKGELIGDINFQDPNEMANRWGQHAFNEVRDAIEETYLGEDKEKMVGAVSSTTVGMESKPRYSNKKDDEEYA